MAFSRILTLLCLLLKVVFYPLIKCIEFIFGLLRKDTDQDYSCDVVLITGAAQGIGKALAIEFARRNATLVLLDINENKLSDTHSQIRSTGHSGEVFSYVVDCSKKDEVYQVAEKVKEEVGNVSVLVNNAGLMNGKSVLQLSDEEINRSIGINILAHYWTVRAFLPWMIENNYGHIIELCSMAGFTGVPKASDYCASKAALLSFAHSLRMELLVQKKTGVAVTCVFPSAVDTELSKIIRSIPNKMDPRECAKKIMKVVRGRPFMTSVGQGYVFSAIQRYIIPTSINNELFKLFVGDRNIDDMILSTTNE